MSNDIKTATTRITVSVDELTTLIRFAVSARDAAIAKMFNPETIDGDADVLRETARDAGRAAGTLAKMEAALERLLDEPGFTPEALAKLDRGTVE